jgi:hypothetical protein
MLAELTDGVHPFVLCNPALFSSFRTGHHRLLYIYAYTAMAAAVHAVQAVPYLSPAERAKAAAEAAAAEEARRKAAADDSADRALKQVGHGRCAEVQGSQHSASHVATQLLVVLWCVKHL